LDSQRIVDEKALCYAFELRGGSTRSGVNGAAQVYGALGGQRQKKQAILSGDSAYCFQEMIRVCMDMELRFTFTANEAMTGWQSHIGEISNWQSWEYTVEDVAKRTRAGKRLGRSIEV